MIELIEDYVKVKSGIEIHLKFQAGLSPRLVSDERSRAEGPTFSIGGSDAEAVLVATPLEFLRDSLRNSDLKNQLVSGRGVSAKEIWAD